MADWSKLDGGGAAPAPAGGSGSKWDLLPAAQAPAVRESTDTPAPEESHSMLPAVLGGGAALAGLGMLATKAPGRIGTAARTLNAVRSQLMLGGLAPLKSVLGNVGAAGVASVERGSLAPLKALLSRETLQDAKAAWKAGTPITNDARQVVLKNPLTGRELPTPGRAMGALDDATQKALQRAGLSSEEATREVLQTPLGTNWGRAGEALDNPVMQYLIPFRRTPLNQLWEGGKAIGRAFEGDQAAIRGVAAYGTAGAVHGAATADDKAPLSVPLAIAGSGRYGLPYGLAALLGRVLASGKGSGQIPGNVLPVSEYGIEQGIGDPLGPFGLGKNGADGLAPIRALKRLTQ